MAKTKRIPIETGLTAEAMYRWLIQGGHRFLKVLENFLPFLQDLESPWKQH